MKETILIIDDDADIRNLIGIYLENEGFNYLKCDNAISAMEILEKNNIDLILLDVMMPGLDGISACTKIRAKNNMPIIFLSAKVEDMDKIQGLMAGGDDYVTKPFNSLELVVRIKAQLRRYKHYNNNYSTANIIEFENVMLNRETRQVYVCGMSITLTPKEYGILEYLMCNKGIVLSPSKIYENVWREKSYSCESVVMTHIANLREKLNIDNNANIIKTVYGMGYKI